MADIVRANFAKECVRQGVFSGANPHYLLGVAQLRSKITADTVGDRVGPFRLTQAEWDLHSTNSAFSLDFLSVDINKPMAQIAVFAVMARLAFDAFESASGRNPSAKELYLKQFPAEASEALSADLKAALDATAALVDPAAEAVLDDDQVEPPKITDPDQHTGPGVFNPAFDAFFTALVPGGFFSADPNFRNPADPNDIRAKRSVRTNNPGAINFRPWQSDRRGFVGITEDDGHGNKTTIYSTPEYGIAAWFHLLAERYGFGTAPRDGSFSIEQLAHKYAGDGASQDDINVYLNAWATFSTPQLDPQSIVHLSKNDEMLNLARALFTHESGIGMPLKDEQILFGIQHERDNSLPLPPARPAVNVTGGGTGGSSQS